jgi:hypothetical protein
MSMNIEDHFTIEEVARTGVLVLSASSPVIRIHVFPNINWDIVLEYDELGATHVYHNPHSSCIIKSKWFMNQNQNSGKIGKIYTCHDILKRQ